MNDSMQSPRIDSDAHERARQMISLIIAGSHAESRGPDEDSEPEFSRTEQSWLTDHLDACPTCRAFADVSREAIRALRGIPITASGSLVSATQARVRLRTIQLQRQQERRWVVSICCAAVTLSSSLTAAALWKGFTWMGGQTRLSGPIWQSGFLVFYLMPAVLAGILLLARGTFLAEHDGSYPD